LALHGGRDLGATVADVAVPERGGRVEIRPAVAIDDLATVPTDDHQFLARDLRHVREGMPERGGRRRGRLRHRLGYAAEAPADAVQRPLDRLAGDAGDHALADAGDRAGDLEVALVAEKRRLAVAGLEPHRAAAGHLTAPSLRLDHDRARGRRMLVLVGEPAL